MGALDQGTAQIGLVGKDHHSTSVGFEAAGFQDIDLVASVGSAAVNTTVQANLPLPQNCKILKVVVNYTAIGTGNHFFNLVVGTGAEAGSVPQKNVVATAGQSVFTTDQQLTSAANTPLVFQPTLLDSIYAGGTLLTLRVVTPGSTGSLTNLKVVLLILPVDAFIAKTGLIDPVAGTLTF